MPGPTWNLTGIIDGARVEFTVEAWTEDEAMDQWYDRARSDTDEFIAADPIQPF